MLASILRVLTPLFLTFTALAAPPAPDPDSPNAAARYIALFENMDKTLVERAAQVHYDITPFTIYGYEGITFTATDVRQTLLDHQDWIVSLIAAASLQHCDFGLDPQPLHLWEPNPTLAPLLAARRTLLADARRCFADGDVAAGLRRADASLRFHAHIGNQANAYAHAWSLISESGLKITLEDTVLLVNEAAARMTDAERHRLLQTLKLFNADDPGNALTAVSLQIESFLDFAEAELRDGVGEQLILQIGRLESVVFSSDLLAGFYEQTGIENPKSFEDPAKRRRFVELVRASEHFSYERLAARVVRGRAILKSLADDWHAPDAQARINAVVAECEADKSTLLANAFSGLHHRWAGSYQRRAKLIELRAALAAQPAPAP